MDAKWFFAHFNCRTIRKKFTANRPEEYLWFPGLRHGAGDRLCASARPDKSCKASSRKSERWDRQPYIGNTRTRPYGPGESLRHFTAVCKHYSGEINRDYTFILLVVIQSETLRRLTRDIASSHFTRTSFVHISNIIPLDWKTVDMNCFLASLIKIYGGLVYTSS